MPAKPHDSPAGRLFNFVQTDFFPVLCHFLLPPSFFIHYFALLCLLIRSGLSRWQYGFVYLICLFTLEISYQKYEYPVNKETAESGETVDRVCLALHGPAYCMHSASVRSLCSEADTKKPASLLL
ncbi:MAG: hypothetical protein IKG23_01840 [Clostridia bacterium]|nr:hypothetical protein [Clostridia bacterium]